MLDRREMIIERLVAILTPLAPNFTHNRGELPAEIRPAITLCDADETADTQIFDKGKRGLSKAPNKMRFAPEIVIVMDDRKSKNPNIGSDLSAYRAKILAAVLFDPGLQTIIGNDGEIQYHGCDTDLGRDRPMNGEMQLRIVFVYPFIPAEINAP